MSVDVRMAEIARVWEEQETTVCLVVRSTAPMAHVVETVQTAFTAGQLVWTDDDGDVTPPVPTPEGVAFWSEDWQDLRDLLGPVVESLDAQAISAVIDVPAYANRPSWNRPGGYPWMFGVPVLETALTLASESDPPRDRIRASAAVCQDVGRAVVRWCADLPGRGDLAVAIGGVPFSAAPAAVLDCWDIAVEVTEENLKVAVDGSEGRFRVGQVHRYDGRVLFVEGPLMPGDVRARLAESRRIMLSAPWASYGYAKATRDHITVASGDSFRRSWVPTPHVGEVQLPFPALDATLVPDTFALQLLGPGHQVPALDDEEWTVTDTPWEQKVVEHRDAEAWFGDVVPPAELVGRARRAFTPLLCRSEDIAVYRRRT